MTSCGHTFGASTMFGQMRIHHIFIGDIPSVDDRTSAGLNPIDG